MPSGLYHDLLDHGQEEAAQDISLTSFYDRKHGFQDYSLRQFVERPTKMLSYEPTHCKPHWILKLIVESNGYVSYSKLQWKETRNQKDFHGYTALSYAMQSARKLFDAMGGKLEDWDPLISTGSNGEGKGKDKYSFSDRRRIVQHYLMLYGSTLLNHHQTQKEPHENQLPITEYVWLDEFCICDFETLQDDNSEELRLQRKEELGRVYGIFGEAAKVVIFCHEEGCRHTGLDCPWGQRVFTLGEILKAKKVGILELEESLPEQASRYPKIHLTEVEAHKFKRDIQEEAEKNRLWHLFSLMESSLHPGSVSWDKIIHALILETIRRDNVSGYEEHNFLGRALNGLLPRRGPHRAFPGKNGWREMVDLLELNQGFYNAAALASVCGVSRGAQSSHWLGEPIKFEAGNERLEPLVHAFPITACGEGKDRYPVLYITTPLRIPIGEDPHIIHQGQSQIIRLRFMLCPLAFSALSFWQDIDNGSFRTRHNGRSPMRSVQNIILIFLHTAALNLSAGEYLLLYCLSIVTITIFLFISTDPVKKQGFLFVDGNLDEAVIVATDHIPRVLHRGCANVRGFLEWKQEIQWPIPRNLKGLETGWLLHLKTRIAVRVQITSRPNLVVALAIHGSGVTCMLLKQDIRNPTKPAEKVGMVNFPASILEEMEVSSSICVAG